MSSGLGKKNSENVYIRNNYICDLTVKGENWDLNVPGLEALVREIFADVIKANFKGNNKVQNIQVEVSFLFTDDYQVQEFNKKFRGQNKPTNVLSFPSETKGALFKMVEKNSSTNIILLGDVMFAFETIFKEAEEQGKDFLHHLSHMIVHGVLHLLGHDHVTNTEAEIMEQIEVKILDELGVPNPYQPIMASLEKIK